MKLVGRLVIVVLAGAMSHVAAAQYGPPVTPEIVAAAAAAKTPVAEGPVQPNWDSIRENYMVPQWFADAKFGITMHWGLFSIPAYHNEWYEKYMYSTFSDWHTKHYGPPDRFGYKDFIPLFTAKKFNADDVAALVKESGAKYFMPTAEHHDGFSLWDSAANPYNAAQMGPKRDLIGEMAVASRKAGLKFGICSHNMEHYTFIHPKDGLATDLNDPKTQDFYWTEHNDQRLQLFLENWVAKNVEIIDKYQPDVLWFDNGVNSRDYDPLKEKVAAYYYNRARQWGKEVTIETKGTAFLAGSVLDFEKLNPRGPTRTLKGVWDAEEPIGSTWGYSAENPVETFRGPQAIVTELATIVSMGGSLLLNLSPDGQGAINAAQRTTLKEIGKWLAVNGEAIYGTHAWVIDGEGFTRLPARGDLAKSKTATAAAALEEGPKAVAAPVETSRPLEMQLGKPTVYRFTVKGEALYAIAQSWPVGGEAVIASLATGRAPEGTIKSVTLLGVPGELKFKQDKDGLKVKMPSKQPCDYAFSLKITGLKMNPAGPLVPAVMADLQ
jgi:alpha-L-fucosidase